MAVTAFEQVANNAQSTLAEDLTNVETDVDVASGHGARFPSPGNGYYLTIWDADTYADPFLDPNMEVIRVTARSTDTLTVTRGQRGTSGVAHSTGHAIRLLVDSELISDLQTAVNKIEDTVQYARLREEFDGAYASSKYTNGWTGTIGGSGVFQNAGSVAGRWGIMQAFTAPTDGYAFLSRQELPAGSGAITIEADVYPVTSDGPFRLGLLDTANADQVDGVYFEMVSGTTNWQCKTADNSTRTTTDSGVAASTSTWFRLRIEINAAGSSVGYYIDNTLVATITTNIPTGTTRAASPAIQAGPAASANGYYNVDFYHLDADLSSTR